MSVLKISAIGLTLALSLTAANAFADCSEKGQQEVGQKVAAAVKSQLSSEVPAQSKRLIKIQSCSATDGVIETSFSYDYVSDKRAYEVEGTARIVDGKVEISDADRPQKIYASIETNYMN